MEEVRILRTKEKALQVNLKVGIYGSFAEIGAGQEVAANFFKVGGASGTIAKTMSAYDMSFSDAIYGKCDRYVTESRLKQMLNKEYGLLPARLEGLVSHTRFFAFADTVEALNFKKTNKPHGWVGLKFQLTPGGQPNECIIHLKMHDSDNLTQQFALGIVGVNLIYGCFFYSDPEKLLKSLLDNLSPDRVEIDMFRISGPDYHQFDNRLMALKLVRFGFTKAAMFGPDGHVVQPSETLYKKNILVLRGRFKPVTRVTVDMLLKALRQFKNEDDVNNKDIVAISELTLNDLRSEGEIDEEDFINRTDIICSMGRHVLISNYTEYYRLVDYLSSFTRGKRIGIILGVNNLEQVFDESYYADLRGGILEAFGTLFGNNVTLYVYPLVNRADGEITTLDDMTVRENLLHLLDYLKVNNKLKKVNGANRECLHVVADDLAEMIEDGSGGWEKWVPKKVELAIKERNLFGYKG
ncbi:MAG: TonB-dependent receptor [Cyclobacteriaceae bacterium]|nr:TonB-dependent receptor [Cyclobacteriaceae bacterium]